MYFIHLFHALPGTRTAFLWKLIQIVVAFYDLCAFALKLHHHVLFVTAAVTVARALTVQRGRGAYGRLHCGRGDPWDSSFVRRQTGVMWKGLHGQCSRFHWPHHRKGQCAQCPCP